MVRKAPGKHFREGISLPQLISMFPDAAAAESRGAQRQGDGFINRMLGDSFPN